MSERITPTFRVQGQFLFLACVVALAVTGWFAYDAMMAPRWMRAFAEELNKRAEITGEFRPEAAFPTLRNRPDPDSPYICISKIADFEWDHMFVIPSGGPVPDSLTHFDWPGESVDQINARLGDDARYQIIAFTSGDSIIDHGYFFTMWGNLSPIATSQGFERANAVFVAESDGRTFTVRPAPPSGLAYCGA